MQLLNKDQINESIKSNEDDSLFIDPLLDDGQIGEVTIDLRLGYDFLVSILTRKPYIGVSRSKPSYRGLASYFQKTRRELGDKFILYPNQVVLTTTLEYISLPSDIYADLLTRSSYTRLGININTMIQPGFRGCMPVELTNQGNNAVELVVGSRVFQSRLFKLNESKNYFSEKHNRKYLANVRPIVSKADFDNDIDILDIISSATSKYAR